MNRKRFAQGAILFSTFAILGLFQNLDSVPDDTFHLYLAPTGTDANTGLSPQSPLRTLTRADRILEANLKNKNRNAIVHIASGRYGGQANYIKFSMPNHSITYVGDAANRPIFDGYNVYGQALWLEIVRGDAKPGDKQNIFIQNLRVTNYFSGIRIGGEGKGYTHSFGGIVISGMVFMNMGKAYDFDKGYEDKLVDAHQVILISDSDGNEIRSCRFVDITNDIAFKETLANPAISDKYKTYGGLHAIYIIRSNRTWIRRNTFFDIYALGIIKFRDFSNFSKIEENVFGDNTNLVRDQFCGIEDSDSDCVQDRIKYALPGNECPSFGNLWRGNKMKYKITSTFRPIIYTEDHPDNNAWCGTREFYDFHQLDPNNIENSGAFQYERVIDGGANVYDPNVVL